MKTFKGFNQNLSCMDFQFNIGETFTHTGNVEACASGFHACENPLDIFTYYPPANSRFCLTESSGDIETHKDDSKIASSILDIVKELSLAELCNYGAEYILNNVIDTETDTGYRSAATNTGHYSTASVEGVNSVAMATGVNSKAKASLGSAIVLCHYSKSGYLIGGVFLMVGEGGIKDNTWYAYNENGTIVEIEE